MELVFGIICMIVGIIAAIFSWVCCNQGFKWILPVFIAGSGMALLGMMIILFIQVDISPINNYYCPNCGFELKGEIE